MLTEGQEILALIVEAHDITDPKLLSELTAHTKAYIVYQDARTRLRETPESVNNWETGTVTRSLVPPLAQFIKDYDEAIFGPL